jgi:hypothetical protein
MLLRGPAGAVPNRLLVRFRPVIEELCDIGRATANVSHPWLRGVYQLRFLHETQKGLEPDQPSKQPALGEAHAAWGTAGSQKAHLKIK